MSDENLYEYALIRYVPSVEREEFVNVGLIMMCKRRRWLKVRVRIPHERLAVFNPPHDISEIENSLSLFDIVCSGNNLHPAAQWPVEERFRWLTAVKSACIETSRPHPGLTSDHEAEFERLFSELVL